MKINRLILYCLLLLSSLNTIEIYAHGSSENDPNEISDYFKNLIKTGEIKPLTLLKTIDNEKYDLIIGFLPENKNIGDYYYKIIIHVEYTEYAIWYYEAFFNKYSGWRGDPTGKCFSILFDHNDEFIRRYLWR
jgi:hypothetical protein